MKRFIAIAILLFTGFKEAKAQQVLTLNEAINIALQKSLGIQIARNSFEAAQVSNHLSMAGAYPTVNATGSSNESLININQKLNNGTETNRKGSPSNASSLGVTGSMLLFNGFRVYATKSRLEALEKQSQQQIIVQIQNVIADVMINYYNIVRQQTLMQTLQQSIDVTVKRKEIVDVRKSVGLANNADTYQAQIDLNASLQDLRSQELVVAQAKADLMNLLAQTADSSFTIRDTIIVDSTVNFDFVKTNIQQNPELLSAGEQIRINQAIEREVASARYPSVFLNAGANYSRSQNAAGLTLLNQSFGPFVGLSLQVPIFNAATRRRQQVAEIDTRNASLSHQSVYNNLETSAVKSWQAYQNNLQRIQTERENYKLAGDLLQLTLERYRLSQATIIEVREAQRSFIDAGYRLVNLAFEAKSAEIELKRLSSKLGV
jgi:outer membrane protein